MTPVLNRKSIASLNLCIRLFGYFLMVGLLGSLFPRLWPAVHVVRIGILFWMLYQWIFEIAVVIRDRRDLAPAQLLPLAIVSLSLCVFALIL